MLNERSISDLSAGQALVDAALLAFAEEGYDGASIRRIAAAAGVSVSILYHYFENKEELLFAMLQRTVDDLIELAEQAVEDKSAPVEERFRRLVSGFARFYAERSVECRVLNVERRRLTEKNHEAHLVSRRRLQSIFDTVVGEGVDAGVFHTPSAKDAAHVVVVMCRDIASWYRTDGPNTAQEIGERYAQLALSLVGYRGGEQA